MKLENVHVVLLRTRNPQNLGAVARAMKNFGLARLTLVQPRTDDLAQARAVAVHAEDVLDGAATVASLHEALAGARWVVGTTVRAIPGQRQLAPRAVAGEAALRTHEGEVALVFGDEESGMSNADLLACHDVSAIPTAPAQPSLNLAQAVLAYAYELFQASQLAAPGAPVEPRADERLLGELEATLRALLEAAAFTEPDRPRHGVRELAHTLRRAGLTGPEARLWQAALRRAEARLRRR